MSLHRPQRDQRGALRWGLLAIGAFGFADVYGTWWTARSDGESIPFGQIEGVLSIVNPLLSFDQWKKVKELWRSVREGWSPGN